MKQYDVFFNGYRRDEFCNGLPEYSGIYMIYRCNYNEKSQTVKLIELFYIGQSKNINQEVCHHARRDEFLSQAKKNETICYSYAHVNDKDLDIVENALIFMQKPRLNENLKENYNHEDARFLIEGKNGLLRYTDFSITNKD